MAVGIVEVVISAIPWMMQVLLIWIGAARNIFNSILRPNSEYCINYVERNRRIENGECLDCTTLYGPWAIFLGIIVLSISSFSTSSLITENRILSVVGWFIIFSIASYFLRQLTQGRVLTMNDIWGDVLLAFALSVSYSLLSLLSLAG